MPACLMLFYCQILRERFLQRNLVTILSPNCLENFRASIPMMEVSKCYKIVVFPEISFKMKIFKTYCEVKTVSYLTSLVEQKLLTSLVEQKFSYEDLQEYRDICFPRASRMQFSAIQKWLSAKVLSDTNQKQVCKVRKIFGCVVGVYFS